MFVTSCGLTFFASLCILTHCTVSLSLQLRNQGQVRGTSAASDEWRRIWPCLAVLTFPRRVLVVMCPQAQVPTMCVYMCVLSVAVYKTHVELQIKIHTLVYICTYKHTEGISTISPKYCTYLQQECKRKYFQYIYLEQILIIIRVIPLMDELTAV